MFKIYENSYFGGGGVALHTPRGRVMDCYNLILEMKKFKTSLGRRDEILGCVSSV